AWRGGAGVYPATADGRSVPADARRTARSPRRVAGRAYRRGADLRRCLHRGARRPPAGHRPGPSHDHALRHERSPGAGDLRCARGLSPHGRDGRGDHATGDVLMEWGAHASERCSGGETYGAARMLIRVGYDMALHFLEPTAMVLMLSLHPSRASTLRHPERLE